MSRATKLLLFALVVCVVLAVVAVAEGSSAATHGANLTYDDGDNVKTAHGANPIQFNFTIEHTGDMLSQETMVELRGKPPTWQHFLIATTEAGSFLSTTTLEALLRRGETAPLSLTITPPPGAPFGMYWMEVNAYPKGDPTQNESYRICVVIPQVADFEISVWDAPPDATYKAIPPTTVTIRFALFNTGNGPDRFLIQGESSRSGEGWTLTFVDGVDEFGYTPELPADPGRKDPHLIHAKVVIPADAHANETTTIVVNATSMFDPSLRRPPALATVHALQYCNFQAFIVGPDVLYGQPGETLTFHARVWNMGNGWDEFSLHPIWDGELNPGFIASTEPRTMLIGPDANGTFDYLVIIPSDAMRKTYFFTVEITSSGPELSPVTESFSVEVGQSFGLDLTCGEPSQTTVAAGVLDYLVGVTNTGNGLDSVAIDMEGVPSGWLTYVQPPEVTLLPGANATVTIRVIVPAALGDAPSMAYTMTVVAYSQRSDAEDTLEITVGVEQFFRIELTLRGVDMTDPERPVAPAGQFHPRPLIDLKDSSQVVITLGVKNMGNGPDTVLVGTFAEDDRIAFDGTSASLELAAGQGSDVYWVVSVPDGMPGGLYRIWVHANSGDPSQETRSVPIDLEVVPLFDEEDFGDLAYLDPTGDEYTFHFEADEHMGRVRSSRGGTGDEPAVDIVSLDVVLDADGAEVIVTVEFSGTVVDDDTTEYWVYLVNPTHRQGGLILAPEDYRSGNYHWDYCDEANVLLSLFLDGDVVRVRGTGEPFDAAVSGNSVVVTLPGKRLRELGLEPGSGFGVYAYAHVLETSTEDGWSMTVTWDSAGVGAAPAPEEFDDRPEDGSPPGAALAPLALAVASLAVVALGRRGGTTRRDH